MNHDYEKFPCKNAKYSKITCDHMNSTFHDISFTNDYVNFTCDVMHFTCDGVNFTRDHIGFTRDHIGFTRDHIGFTYHEGLMIIHFYLLHDSVIKKLGPLMRDLSSSTLEMLKPNEAKEAVKMLRNEANVPRSTKRALIKQV